MILMSRYKGTVTWWKKGQNIRAWPSPPLFRQCNFEEKNFFLGRCSLIRIKHQNVCAIIWGVLLSLNIIFQKQFPIYWHQESCQEFPLSSCSRSQVRTAFSRAQTEALEAQFGKQVQFCISRLSDLSIAGLFKVGLEHENSFNVRCIWVDFLPFGFLHFPGSV